MSGRMVDSTDGPCPVLYHGLTAFGIALACAKRSRHWKHEAADGHTAWAGPIDAFPDRFDTELRIYASETALQEATATGASIYESLGDEAAR